MAKGNTVEFGVKFNVDKNGLLEIKNSLKAVQADVDSFSGASLKNRMNEIATTAKKLDNILDMSWNNKLNQLDLTKFNNEITNSFGSVKQLKSILEQTPAGAEVYNRMASAVLNTNIQLKQSNKLLDEMFESMSNTIKWGITSGIFNTFTNSIQRAYGFVKDLDRSLNEIRIVTGQSAEEMDEFAKKASEVAVSLGKSSSVNFTDASLIFYQQGLAQAEAEERARITLKASNVTGQTAATVSEQLTSVWNGYKVGAKDAELYVDRLAAVAKTSASSLAELSAAMSKTAAAANSMGVSEEQLASMLGTIISATRQAPESIGNAVKTFLARISSISAGTDDAEVSLNKYTASMAEMGINVLDSNQKLRNLGDVIEEVGTKWQYMSREQQVSLVQTMAGTRQYSNFIALFDNWDQYHRLLDAASNAEGELQKQQDIYMESTKAHLNQVTAQAERIYKRLLRTDDLNTFFDVFSSGLSGVATLLEGLNTDLTTTSYLTSTVANIFSKQIGKLVSEKITNLQIGKEQDLNIKKRQEIIDTGLAKGERYSEAQIQAQLEQALKIQKAEKYITKEEKQQAIANQQKIGAIAEQIDRLKNYSTLLTQNGLKEEDNAQVIKDQIAYLKEKLKYESEIIKVFENESYRKGSNDTLSQEFATLSDEALAKYVPEAGYEYFDLDEQEKKIKAANSKYSKYRGDIEYDKVEELRQRIIESFNEDAAPVLGNRDDLKILEEARRQVSDLSISIDEIVEGYKLKKQYEEGSLELLQSQENALENENENIFEQAEFGEDIDSTIQGVTSLISLGSTAWGIFETLSDETATLAEKTDRFFALVLSALPMIIENFDDIVNLLPNIAKLTGLTAEKVSNLSALKYILGALKSAKVLLVAGTFAAIAGAILIAYKNACALDEEIKKVDKSAEELNKTLEEKKGIADTFSNLKREYEDALVELRKYAAGTDEYYNALDIANEKAKSLISSNEKLANTYQKNSEGLIVFNKDLMNSIDEVQRKELDTLQNIADATAITQKKLAQQKEAENLNKSVDYFDYSSGEHFGLRQDTLDQLVAIMKENDGAGLKDSDIDNLTGVSKNMIETIKDHKNEIEESIRRIIEIDGSIKKLTDSLDRSYLEEKNKTFASRTEKDKDFLQYLLGNKIGDLLEENYKKVSDEIEKMTDYQLHQEFAKINNLTSTDTNTLFNPMGEGEFLDASGATSTYRDTQIRELVKRRRAQKLTYGSEGDSPEIAQANHLLDQITELGERIGKDQGIQSFANNLKDFIQGVDTHIEGIDNFTAKQKEKLKEAINNLDLFDELDLTGTALDTGHNRTTAGIANSLITTILKQIDEQLPDEKLESNFNTISEDLFNTIGSMQTKMRSGDLRISNAINDEDFQKLQEQLEALGAEEQGLEAYIEEVSRAWDVGTDRYTTALEIIKEKLISLNIEKLNKEIIESTENFSQFFEMIQEKTVNELGEHEYYLELKPDIDPVEFEAALDEYLNIEYEIDVKLHLLAENEFNSVINAIDDINTRASMIGENFVVAAEDVRALAATFPGILEQVTYLRDGTVQLNTEIAQSAIDSAKLEVAADAETATARLANLRDTLLAKQQIYKRMAQAAQVLADAEVHTDKECSDAKAVISAGITQLKQNNQQAVEKFALNSEENIVNKSLIYQKIMADNDEAKYKAMTQASAQSAIARINNELAVTNKDKGLVTSDIKGVNYTGTHAEDAELANLEKVQELIEENDRTGETNKEAWQEVARQFESLANLNGEMANDLNAMIVQINASQNKVTNNLNSLRTGAGIAENAAKKAKSSSGGSKKKAEEKVKDPDFMEYLDEEFDKFHDINVAIKALDRTLNRLSKTQSKLYGKELIGNLNDQLAVLEQQKEAYQDKIELARREAAELRQSLMNNGVEFDSRGYVANYIQALEAKQEYLNMLIAKYNAMTAEEQEKFKEVIEDAKKEYENFKKELEEYDTIMTETIPELEEQIEDTIDKEIEINIKKFTMEIELRLEMGDAERRFNEFEKKVVDKIKDDDILGNAQYGLKDFLSYYNTAGTGIGSIQALTKQIYGTMDQIRQIDSSGWASAYGNNKQQAMEDLQKYADELMTQLEDIEDLVDKIKESYLDMIDEATEAFEKQVDQYEYISDMIEHNMNVIGLLYGDDAYESMNKYYEQMEVNNNKELDFLKKRAAYAEEMFNKETDPKAREKWQEEWQNALEELNEKVEDALDNIINKYKNSVNLVFKELNNKITGGLGLDYVGDQWDLINKNADMYLDKINMAYEIQKLEDKYLDSIDQADSVGAQQKLNDLMNIQLAMLKDKDKLTQYDVDRANLLYEIALKELALENARQNKSKLRLRRDAQGNYSYQYVSDEDSIAEARKELMDAQNDLYNLDKDKYRDNLNQIYNIYLEFQEKILQLYLDQTLSAEERQEKEKLLVEEYGKIINGLVEQNEEIRTNLHESAFLNLANMYNKNVEDFYNMSQAEQDILLNDLIPQWDSGVQHMTDVFAGEGGFIPTCEEAFERLKDVTRSYQDSLDELQQAAAIDFDLIEQGYDRNIMKLRELIANNDELIARYQQEISAIQAVISQLNALIAQYQAAQQAAIAAAEAAYKFAQAQRAAAAAAASSGGGGGGSSGSSSKRPSSNKKPSSSSKKEQSSSDKKTPKKAKKGDKLVYIGGKYYADSDGRNPVGWRGQGQGLEVEITYTAPGHEYPLHAYSTDSAYGWLKPEQLMWPDGSPVTFRSGGYTGEWNDKDGKLAVLHEKELILNKDDTKNILSAVDIVRSIDNMMSGINGIEHSITNAMENLFLKMNWDNITDQNTSAQPVIIEASFPNVNVKQEIIDAFNNLTNSALQYSNNKKIRKTGSGNIGLF